MALELASRDDEYEELDSVEKIPPGTTAKVMVEFENGDSYKGETKDGRMHGFGVYHFSNGDVYEGDYVADVPHGQGKFTFHDGRYDWRACLHVLA